MKEQTEKEKLKTWISIGKDFDNFLRWLRKKHPRIYAEYFKRDRRYWP